MTADKECLWCFNQDDFQNISRERTGYLKWAKEMESSKRYLLQAEIEYWHEMLQLNQRRLSKIKEEEMRACLQQAMRALNTPTIGDFKVAA